MLGIEIQNDQTGTDESANYRYVVTVNYRRIATGRVCGHNRADDWHKLLALIVKGKELPADAVKIE